VKAFLQTFFIYSLVLYYCQFFRRGRATPTEIPKDVLAVNQNQDLSQNTEKFLDEIIKEEEQVDFQHSSHRIKVNL